MEKLAAWAEAGADDAMPARREKAIFARMQPTYIGQASK
jgi:hypothetical protein